MRATLAGAAAALLLCAGPLPAEPRRADAARLMNELMSGTAEVGGPFTLPDQWGRQRSLADFRGKLVLLYFGFASCPDVCPTDLAVIGEALRLLGEEGDAVQPLFVTLDPQRDTPRVLREYVAAFHPRFVALRGSEAQTKEIATRYKVFYEKVPQAGSYTVDHMAFTFVLDRDGRYVAFLPPGTRADRMATLLRQTLGDK